MVAFGSNNISRISPQQDEAMAARGISVTYKNISADIVTVSGYLDNGQTIVYQRDVVGPGAIDTLYWKYPAGEKARWDAAVTLTALAFRPGDVAVPH